MIPMRLFSILLVISLIVHNSISQKGPENFEENDELTEEDFPPEEGRDDSTASSTGKPSNEVSSKKTYFSDDRFVKLFQTRRDRPRPSPLAPRFASKPKPTLPSFIKNTPQLIKVQPQPTAKASNVIPQRATTASPPKSVTSQSRNPSKVALNSNVNRKVKNQPSLSTASSVSSTTESPSKRRFGANAYSRQRNSTSLLKNKRT